MRRRIVRGRTWYHAVVVLAGGAAALFPFLWSVPGAMPPALPQLASWIATHPADWYALSALTDQALDSTSKEPVRLWRTAHLAATHLAPLRDAPRVAFVRSGLLHWMDLAPADRSAVLGAAAPLLRDPETFERMATPLFNLTGDLRYLAANNGGDIASLGTVAKLAASSGDFVIYRETRPRIAAAYLSAFRKARDTAAARPEEFLGFIPEMLTTDFEDLVKEVLAELHRRPLIDDPGAPRKVDALVDFGIRHGVGPLDGLAALMKIPSSAAPPTLARLALHLGAAETAAQIQMMVEPSRSWAQYFVERAAYEREQGRAQLAQSLSRRAADLFGSPEWSGLCGANEVCTRAVHQSFSLGSSSTVLSIEGDSADAPYCTVYFDDIRIGEGLLRERRSFTCRSELAGVHTIGVTVANPFTRDGRERRVRIAAPRP